MLHCAAVSLLRLQATKTLRSSKKDDSLGANRFGIEVTFKG